MGAHLRYEPAYRQLLALAIEAREEGLPFPEFWDRAIRPGLRVITWKVPEARRPHGCVVWPNDTLERRIARASVLEVRDAWRRAYDREPATRGERALTLLSPLLDAATDAAPVLVAA